MLNFLNKFDYDLNHNYNRLNILVFKGYPIDKMIENHIVFLIQQKYPELENCQLEIKQGKAFV